MPAEIPEKGGAKLARHHCLGAACLKRQSGKCTKSAVAESATVGAEETAMPVPVPRVERRSKLRQLVMQSVLTQDKAQSLVEFSLILPVFLLVITGMFAFGITYNNWLVLTDATSIGGRQIAIRRGNTLDPCSDAATAIQGAAPGLNTSNLTYAFVINGASYSGSSCSSSSTSTGAAGNLVQGGYVLVTVTYPCNLAVYGKNLIPGCALQASVKELVQ